LFQGRHLKRGSRLVDFDIKLGDSECVPVSLTDHQVECKPSKDIRNINHMNCPDETLSADVCIYFLCCEAVPHIVRRKTVFAMSKDQHCNVTTLLTMASKKCGTKFRKQSLFSTHHNLS